MELIAISHPEFIPYEAARINRLFRDGWSRLHLRKPLSKRGELAQLIGNIDAVYHSKIALHQHFDLAKQFGITRLHLPEQLRKDTPDDILETLKKDGFLLSTSVHDMAQLARLSKCFDYAFYGPVFDSISKKGYRSIIKEDFILKQEQKTVKVIAIGGITDSNLNKIKQMNFDGAAMLGAIWHHNSKLSNFAVGLSQRQLEISDFHKIDKLQFISNQNAGMSHLESIDLALEAGCRWIQLRVKDQAESDVLEIAKAAKGLCDGYNAKLIINDFPNIAKTVNAYGLHLGLNDMSIPEARQIVGSKIIIGGTANTLDDIILRIYEGADYIGLGPFRFTTTKQNLSPILGLEGYHKLVNQLLERSLSIPIIAIGGILPDDIPTLLSTGIHGVAMSSALIQSAEPKETVQKLNEILC